MKNLLGPKTILLRSIYRLLFNFFSSFMELVFIKTFEFTILPKFQIYINESIYLLMLSYSSVLISYVKS